MKGFGQVTQLTGQQSWDPMGLSIQALTLHTPLPCPPPPVLSTLYVPDIVLGPAFSAASKTMSLPFPS